MSETEIQALKAALGATTDGELATALGVERTSISQWRRRGSVPQKYRAYLGLDEMVSEVTRLLTSGRKRVLDRIEYHYWVRAALAFMPSHHDDGQKTFAERGRSREEMLMTLLNLAMVSTNAYLGKRWCESEADYDALIDAMMAHHYDLICSITDGEEESPQSESSIAGSGGNS